jgi:hypothetical protein
MTAAALGTLYQAYLEERAERRLRQKGITITEVPVRPKAVVECTSPPQDVMHACKDGVQSTGLRIKNVEVDDPLRMVLVTRASFYSFRERITIEVGATGPGGSELAISSVPWLPTTRVDGGVNYSNVFLLSEYVKARLGVNRIVRERLIDLDNQPSDGERR